MTNKTTNTLPFKVKCTYIDNDCLTVGKEYDVIDVDNGFYKVKNDSGEFWWYCNNRFETLDRESNPKEKQDYITLGSKVWVVNDGNVTVDTIVEVRIGNSYCYETERASYDKDGFSLIGDYSHARIFLINETNQKALQVVYPHIQFELPPKELKGSDLCFKKLRNGKKLVMCAVSDLSDERAIKRLQDGDNYIRIIKDYDPKQDHFIDVHGIIHGFAVPLNDETGEPLTEDILNGTI